MPPSGMSSPAKPRTKKEDDSSSTGEEPPEIDLSQYHFLFVVLAAAFQCLFFLGSQFTVEDDPKEGLTYYPQYTLVPQAFLTQHEHFFEKEWAVLVSVRSVSCLLPLVFAALGHRTMGALFHIADIGGFGICFHYLHSDASLWQNAPLLLGPFLAVAVILSDPANKEKDSRQLGWMISCAFIVGQLGCVLLTTNAIGSLSQRAGGATLTSLGATDLTTVTGKSRAATISFDGDVLAFLRSDNDTKPEARLASQKVPGSAKSQDARRRLDPSLDKGDSSQDVDDGKDDIDDGKDIDDVKDEVGSFIGDEEDDEKVEF